MLSKKQLFLFLNFKAKLTMIFSEQYRYQGIKTMKIEIKYSYYKRLISTYDFILFEDRK